MSDDSKQLSVAELLARNGQQGSSSPGGGGRRRRSGRGISVAELTGDLPAIPAGGSHSAHAAPDEPETETPSYEAPTYDSGSFSRNSSSSRTPAPYEPAPYQPSAFESPAPEPVSYTPPQPAPELPNYSPMSGPIARYDPLSAYVAPEPDPLSGRANRAMPGREMPTSRHSGPADQLSPPTASPEPYTSDPHSGGNSPSAPPLGSGRTGRRRRQTEPDDEHTTVRPPMPDAGRAEPNGSALPGPGQPADHNGFGSGRVGRRRAEAEDVGLSTGGWSAFTHGANGFAPSPEPAPEPQAQRSPSRRDGASGPGDNTVPAWSARRRKSPAPQNGSAPESGGIPTSAWSLASQDQQLVSGQTVAGDLLRDGVERAERAERANGERAGRRNNRDHTKRAGRDLELADLDVMDGRTDVYPSMPADDLDDLDDLDDDVDDDAAHYDSDDDDAVAPSRRSRIARKAQDDANRKQWMILGGQSAGAAVAGMLLFKGFERMWEMLPWVALALAMIVILGLVALVRILRRRDDILSTVIAVVVGIFVTLGPLAFLLSTN
ncbi:hypothetical protein [Nocardia australiensis]|uniref:hypothetical protein n=1 Tax=Nocardia australiensis TaxID=2887191 RepID=UPI001D154AF8|nr:hypothetical protein [Nocardia australiensis]